MWKVQITNILNNKDYSATFETEEESNAWKQKQIENNSWGYGHRFVTLEDDYNESLVLSQEFGVDEYGNPTSIIELKPEYEITITNLSLDAEWVNSQVIEKRKEEYQKIDSLLMEALVEKELGDSTKWNEYIILRNQIKMDNPK